MLLVEAGIYLANLLAMVLFFKAYHSRFVTKKEEKIFFLSVAFKGFVTLASGWIFLYYFSYTTDPQVFHIQASALKEIATTHPNQWLDLYWFNNPKLIPYAEISRAYYFVKLLSILHFITNDSYWLNCFWLSLFSLSCTWYFCKTIKDYFSTYFIPAVVAFLWIPTTVFWSSGLLKETIILGILSLFLSCVLHFCHGTKTKGLFLLFSLSFYVLIRLKFYVAGSIALVGLPLAGTYWLLPVAVYKRIWLVWTSYALLFFITFCLLNCLCTFVYHATLFEFIYYNYVFMGEDGHMNYTFSGLTTSAYSFLQYLPEALWQGIWMPLPWNSGSFITKCESMVNFCILVFTCLLVFLKKEKVGYAFPEKLIFLLLLLYVGVSAIAFALSTPNWGTLARYKVMYIPFFHLLLLKSYWQQKGVKRFFVHFRQFQLF